VAPRTWVTVVRSVPVDLRVRRGENERMRDLLMESGSRAGLRDALRQPG